MNVLKVNHRRSQNGSVLIVVLVMLIVIAIAGTWAIRSSITSLNISTNAQASSLLVQNSDSVFFTLENKTSNALQFAEMRIGDGMLAYALRPENKGKELVFCVRGNVTDNFSGSRIASSVYWQNKKIVNTELGQNGFCQTTRGDFISGRQAVMTQVTVRAADTDRDWEHMMEGDDKESSKSTGIQRVVITATSLLPNLSSASVQQVNNCLKNHTSFVDPLVENDTVTDCLARNNVPYSTQDMEYSLRTLKASS